MAEGQHNFKKASATINMQKQIIETRAGKKEQRHAH